MKKTQIVALVDTMMFRTSLREQCSAAGAEVILPSRNAQWTLPLIDGEVSAILVELSSVTSEREATVTNLLSTFPRVVQIGFASHIDKEAPMTGKRLGISRIIPRSRLSDTVVALLKGDPE